MTNLSKQSRRRESVSQIQTQEKPVTYSIQLLGSDGKTYTANLKEHQDWLLKHLGITHRLESMDKRIYELSNLLNVLTDNNKFVTERLGKLILERLPIENSIRRWDLRKLHPALEVNLQATYESLKFLVNEGKVTDKRGWIKRVKKA